MSHFLFLLQEGISAAPTGSEVPHEGGETEQPLWLVEQVNRLLGHTVVAVERVIMPPIYGLFHAQWHEPSPENAIPMHVIMAFIAFGICLLGGLLLRGKLSVDRPSRGQQLLELIVIQIRGLLDQVVGPYGRNYVPVVGAFALFILIGNLMGQIPGLEAPTTSLNVTGALGVSSFLYYMARGFRQQGLGYLKHFTGGLTGAFLPLGVIIFFVELLSNFVRPVTLSLRLFVNMFADKLIGENFLRLFAPIVPLFTVVLGVFVAFVQTFIFIMLSMVYLMETIPHEEHDSESHAHGHEAEAAAAH